jgi:hypothetical protein
MVTEFEKVRRERIDREIQMLKNQRRFKFALLGLAILLPTIFGIVCSSLKVIPGNSADKQVFGTALLPQQLTEASGLQLFAIILLCTMVIITAILAVIALTRRMTNRVSNK